MVTRFDFNCYIFCLVYLRIERIGDINLNPDIKVTGSVCVCVCLSVPKDLTNSLTDMVLLIGPGRFIIMREINEQ